MSWITVAKPTSSTWTFTNPQGLQQYDEATLTYDDSAVFYDSYNPSQYTTVSKPVSPASWVSIAKPT